MQPHCLHTCGNLTAPGPLLASRHCLTPQSRVSVSCAAAEAKGRRKENVWSVDNEAAAAAVAAAEKKSSRPPRRRRGKGKGWRTARKGKDSKVLVSGAMLMEVETVLQTEEPVIKPAWDTFASSLSGIWKGVGAVFSPITAEMEPIAVGKKNENLYDCYTISHIEKSAVSSHGSEIRRKSNWVAFNSFGETGKQTAGSDGRDHYSSHGKGAIEAVGSTTDWLAYESFDLKKSEVLEEDAMVMEPGLVFFEDGSYSRGPADVPVGEFDESKYFLSPTFKFEQCLVKGCHKRLRIVHTIEFNEGGASIQIVRVAVYEEQWASPANLNVKDNMLVELKPFSQRRRIQPSELTGSWKAFEVSATPIFSSEAEADSGETFVYLCTETLKKRTLPESSVSFGEEERLDMQDVTVLWLPGGITAYVDVDSDGILCIGVGWYSEEGVNLVMERDYGTDGNLKEVRWKSEVKRRWSHPTPL